ncbi:aldo/keto reductase [Mangrovibacter plantisponsor]|uniref:Spore coat polysaccharide biosynthesis protein SpsF (Cytidylyltransferase family) n=1 Tax=Mangrovibacter plantisponsor TaxID=451513 RepID=A0A317Q7S9_9ENTR|nr:aldo/keto reductase [Mangrovibacter plantisponsor]PWW11552.1 spore coat polysaccharide biosynthesis protein SpsF (cytidylyltransferase family) [Mangrovibacter plantisponsor]
MENIKSIIIIQSRFNSTRLPGKALFTINGIPLVILAAKRAGNTGRKVIIATSDQSTDDEIELCAKHYGITCVRGSLNDTLARFAKAVKDYPPETRIFRLTADNILPDGSLLDDMESQYIISSTDYMVCDNIGSNVPYGVSAELMRVEHIINANKNANSDDEREHVTPYIRNHFKVKYYEPKKIIGFSNYRCTIDTFDDYLSVKKIFTINDDIISMSLYDIIKRFDKLLFKPCNNKAIKPMVLGSVQFGMNYGITNAEGRASPNVIEKIIKQAITEGIEYIDTAAAYGESEATIGKTLTGGWLGRVKIITKTPPFTELENCDDPLVYSYATQASIFRSCMNLGTEKLDIVMLHRANHLVKYGGAVFNELLKYKVAGKIHSLGVSVQNPDELSLALSYEDIEFIQLPYNILDKRWDHLIKGILDIKKKRNLVIHARSSLLQGLLNSNDSNIWEIAHVKNHVPIRTWLEKIQKDTKKISIADLCIGYVNSQKWIDAVVIGIDDMNQLHDNINSISKPFISDHLLSTIDVTKPDLSENTLNPSRWNKK